MEIQTESPKTTEEGAPRCRFGSIFGSKTKDPCWREATERMIAEQEEPELCPEHYRLVGLGRKVDEYVLALDKLRQWIAEEVDSEYENPLMAHAYPMRANLEAEYWRVAIEARAGEIIANAGPGERIDPEAAHRFAEVALRTDALERARGLLEDAPEDFFSVDADRWEIVAGVAAAVDAAHEEHERCKREMRL